MIYKLTHKESPNNSFKDFSSIESGFAKYASVNNTLDYSIPEYTPISDQATLSSCAANATADSFEILMGVQNKNSVIQLSRLFLYYNARVYTKSTNEDEGCYISHALDSLTTLGICREDTWKYDILKVFAQPSLMAFAEANDNKLSDFYKINKNRLDNVEQAVRSNHPVIFGTPVSQAFTQARYGTELPIFDFPSVSVGRHAMIVVGVKYINGKRYFEVRNSWGKSWGYNGHWLMTEDYLNNSETNDIWVATLMPNLVI